MTETTHRFDLPLLVPGQAQKEHFHNEALMVIDALLHPVAEAIQSVPPAAPTEGQCWIVASSATGAWSGHAGSIAFRTAGGWRFVQPTAGMSVRIGASGPAAWCDGADWTLPPTLARATGGNVVDMEARAALDVIASALLAAGFVQN